MNITMLLASLTVLPAELFNNDSLAFLSGYLKNQKNLIVFNLNDQIDHRLDEAQKVFVRNPIIGIEFWNITNDESQLEFHDMGEGIGDPSTIKSYIVFVDSAETFLDFLPKFTKINSNGKWIFIFDNHTLEEVELVFVKAWKRHKMLNILGVIFMNRKRQFCLYNPFKFNPKGVRGVFYYFNSDEWNNAKEIYKNRLNNLYEYPLKSYYKRCFEFPIYNHNNKILRHQYIDGTFLTCFQQIMNFKYEFLRDNEAAISSSQNLTGNLILIENNEIDFPSSSSFITRLSQKNVAYLQTMDITTLCYVVPKQEIPINHLLTQFEIFSLSTKIVFIITIACLMIVWVSIEFIRSKTGQKHDSINDMLLIIGQAHVISSIHNLSKYNNRGMLIFVSMFFFVICNTYQGIIASSLVHQPEAEEIDTLEGVDRSEFIFLSTEPPIFRPTPDDVTTKSIYYRLFKKPKTFIHSKALFLGYKITRKTAILTNSADAKFVVSAIFDRKTGGDVTHVVEEKLFKVYRSFMIPKNSPYRQRFNQIVNRLIESGIVELEKSDVNRLIYLRYIKRTKLGFGEPPRLVVIKMDHLDQLIHLWIGCMLIAILAFLLEIVFHFFFESHNIHIITVI